MVDNYMLDKMLDRTKEIKDIEEFYNTKLLVKRDDTLSDDIILKMLWY